MLQGKLNKQTVIIIAVVAVVGFGLLAMQSSKSSAPSISETSVEQVIVPTSLPSGFTMQKETTNSAMEESLKKFTVDGKNFSFAPSEIRVKKGDTVKIIFKSVGGNHDWVIDAFNAKTKRVSDGQDDTIQFLADKAGKFEYYCSVGKHRELGMKGTLIVE